ncbi:hypothetical protein GF366_03615 [Candidatus Peregrinibacteria bacterium]|nr:hypothetical protein [Candidatus Peregrinibacteria bacterium]
MNNKTLTFDISALLNSPAGESVVYRFKGPVNFEGIEMDSDLSGKVEIMRIDEGFNVVARDVGGKVKLSCKKCLEKFSKKIKIKNTERIFFLERPKNIKDINDLYLVDKKHLTVDLKEMIRQELILHFPVISVCSTHCKGICPVCGKNLNKEKCNCKINEESKENKPLSELKNLLK